MPYRAPSIFEGGHRDARKFVADGHELGQRRIRSTKNFNKHPSWASYSGRVTDAADEAVGKKGLLWVLSGDCATLAWALETHT